MKKQNLFKWLFAAMLVFAASAFVGCSDNDEENDDFAIPTLELSQTSLNFDKAGGEQSFDITTTGSWTITGGEDLDWLAISPARAGQGNANVKVSVADSETNREAELTVKVFTVIFGIEKEAASQKISITQTAGGGPVTTEELYFDNFDKEIATKTYGTSGESWPYLDQFPGFANPKGPAAANVTYSGKGMSVRANSESNGSHSDVPSIASGGNNLFFGSGASLLVEGLKLTAEQKNLKLTFLSEKYLNGGDNVFKTDEFLLYASKDKTTWASIPYEYAAGATAGQWNVATANFTLSEVPETLYLKVEAKVASAYRLDDLRLMSGIGGAVVDLNNGSTPGPEPGPDPVVDALYFDNFDKEIATQTYGTSGNSWPYLDQFPGFANPQGPAAANVTYSGKGMSVRANAQSNGSYSDVPTASGGNNLFFGSGASLMVEGLKLTAEQKNLKLTFVSEKYLNGGDNVFKTDELLLYASKDNATWASIPYEYAAGAASGRWNVATANFTLSEVPETLYLKIEAKVASAYRIDDLCLAAGEGGTVVNLAGGDTPGPGPVVDALYFDNFDKEIATKTYGTNGESWPYLDQFPGFANPQGPAAANVTYSGKGMSVRANSASNGEYSDVPTSSGGNNLFFGSGASLMVEGLKLTAEQKNLKLTFVSEKYLNGGDNVFKTDELLLYASKDNATWASIPYEYAAGAASGRWNVATANFTLSEVPETLYLKIEAKVASAYRIDDLCLAAGEGGTVVNLAGGDTPGPGPVEPATGFESDAAFVCAADDSANFVYTLTKDGSNSTFNGKSATGFKLGKSKATGVFTSAAVGVQGDYTLSFYAVAWKGTSNSLYVRVNGGGTIAGVSNAELKGNDGATGNPPYTIAVTNDNFYTINIEGLTPTSTITFASNDRFESETVESNSNAARAVVARVRLTEGKDSAKPEEGGETPGPQPTEAKAITIPEIIERLTDQQTVLDAESDRVFEAVVVTDKEGGNVNGKNLQVMTPGATTMHNGITLYGSGKYTDPNDPEFAFAKGDKVRVTLKAGQARIVNYNGMYEITGNASGGWVEIEKIGTAAVTPVEITADMLDAFQGMAVTIKEVMPPSVAANWCETDKYGQHNFIATQNAMQFVVFVQSNMPGLVGVPFNINAVGEISGYATVYKNKAQLCPQRPADVAAFMGGTTPDPTPDPDPEPDPDPSIVTYNPVTKITSGKKYLIVAEIDPATNFVFSAAAISNGKANGVPVKVENNAIASSEELAAMAVTFTENDGVYTIQTADGQYVEYAGSGTNLSVVAAPGRSWTSELTVKKTFLLKDTGTVSGGGTVRALLFQNNGTYQRFGGYALQNADNGEYVSVMLYEYSGDGSTK